MQSAENFTQIAKHSVDVSTTTAEREANYVDHYYMLHSVASNLGLHCLLRPILR